MIYLPILKTMKTIKHCRLCGSKLLQTFFDLGKQPYANSLLRAPDTHEKTYPLSLSYCNSCSLVQLNQTASPKELFDNYVWVTGTAQTTRDWAERFCFEVLKRQSMPGRVLELASNDGTFLKPFVELGIPVLGIDPAKNIVDMANGSGINTICQFFGASKVNRILLNYDKASVVIARNVLPHVENLHSFVRGMEKIMLDDGLMVIEFHYAGAILGDLHYDSIYHEHLHYFTLKTLDKLLRYYNLYIQDLMFSPINAGNLVVFVRKGSGIGTKAVFRLIEQEKKFEVNKLGNWKGFAHRANVHKQRLLNILKGKENIVGYGSSARSSTLLNYCGIRLPIIADDNYLKQGKYTAGTQIYIDHSDNVMGRFPDYVLILAWNFAGEIMKSVREKYGYRGRFIIPLPKLKII